MDHSASLIKKGAIIVNDAYIDWNTDTVTGQKKVLKLYRSGELTAPDRWIDKAAVVIPKTQQETRRLSAVLEVVGNRLVCYLFAIIKDKVSGKMFPSVSVINSQSLNAFEAQIASFDEEGNLREVDRSKLHDGLRIEVRDYVIRGETRDPPVHRQADILKVTKMNEFDYDIEPVKVGLISRIKHKILALFRK